MNSRPTFFREAIRYHLQRRVAPTRLRSADLQRIDADVLRASFFSAQTTLNDLLGRYKSDLAKLIAPQQVRRTDRMTTENPEGFVTEGTTEAEIRTGIKQLLSTMDYQPDPAKRGTIEDLSSDNRIDLVVKINAEMAQNYGWWQQGQDPDLLAAYPCQELYRAEDRHEKRNWIERWRGAGGQIYAGTSPGLPLQPGFSGGRLIARKDSPVWVGISAFGNPYPPFDFGSGVDERDVSAQEAIDLGAIRPGETPRPQQLNFGASLAA